LWKKASFLSDESLSIGYHNYTAEISRDLLCLI